MVHQAKNFRVTSVKLGSILYPDKELFTEVPGGIYQSKSKRQNTLKYPIEETKSLEIVCKVSNWFDWCAFVFANGIRCEWNYDHGKWNSGNKIDPVNIRFCETYIDQVEFIGNYQNGECGIRLKRVLKTETGLLSCDFEQWLSHHQTRGTSPEASFDTIMLDIVPETYSRDPVSYNPHFILLNEVASFEVDPNKMYSHFVELRRHSSESEIFLEGYALGMFTHKMSMTTFGHKYISKTFSQY